MGRQLEHCRDFRIVWMAGGRAAGVVRKPTTGVSGARLEGPKPLRELGLCPEPAAAWRGLCISDVPGAGGREDMGSPTPTSF